MMYPLIEFNDKTVVVHSDVRERDGKEVVRVHIERPVEGGFKSATCFLPYYEWVDVIDFNQEDIAYYEDVIKSMAHLIFRFARGGGLEHASSF